MASSMAEVLDAGATRKEPIVVIEVDGGVAEVSYCPPNVRCVIYDHDDEKEEGLTGEERDRAVAELLRKAQNGHT